MEGGGEGQAVAGRCPPHPGCRERRGHQTLQETQAPGVKRALLLLHPIYKRQEVRSTIVEISVKNLTYFLCQVTKIKMHASLNLGTSFISSLLVFCPHIFFLIAYCDQKDSTKRAILFTLEDSSGVVICLINHITEPQIYNNV